jgi:hypothetical protein
VAYYIAIIFNGCDVKSKYLIYLFQEVTQSFTNTHRLVLFSECRILIISHHLVSAQLVSTQINDAPMETIDHRNTK